MHWCFCCCCCWCDLQLMKLLSIQKSWFFGSCRSRNSSKSMGVLKFILLSNWWPPPRKKRASPSTLLFQRNLHATHIMACSLFPLLTSVVCAVLAQVWTRYNVRWTQHMTFFCKVYLYPIFWESNMKGKHLLELNIRLASVNPLHINMNSTYQHCPTS